MKPFSVSLSRGNIGSEAWTGVLVSDVVLSGVWSYCHKHCLPDRVLTGCEVASCAAKMNFSFSELQREATVTLSSSYEREMTLEDLTLNLDWLESHCLSSIISGCINMISPDLVINRMRPWPLDFQHVG